MKERVQKIMALAGIGSRRANEDLIRAGRVRINGKVAQLGDQADLSSDVIEVDGTRLSAKSLPERVYYAVHKPRNVLAHPTLNRDDERRTVRELLPDKGHLFSIGRLDADSDGLIVLTNDGDLAQKLSHPRYHHTKTYRVVVAGLPTAETIEKWENGVFLEEGRSAPCYVKVIKGSGKESTLKIVMTEGKKRQIRRIASILGHPAVRLTRVAIGMLELGSLKSGEWRTLDANDLKLLSTPAPELKAIRGRKRSFKRDTDDELSTPQGTGKNDDVRSERQRRAARGETSPRQEETSDEQRPRRRNLTNDSPPRGKRPAAQRPSRERSGSDDTRGKRRSPSGSRTSNRSPRKRGRGS